MLVDLLSVLFDHIEEIKPLIARDRWVTTVGRGIRHTHMVSRSQRRQLGDTKRNTELSYVLASEIKPTPYI